MIAAKVKQARVFVSAPTVLLSTISDARYLCNRGNSTSDWWDCENVAAAARNVSAGNADDALYSDKPDPIMRTEVKYEPAAVTAPAWDKYSTFSGSAAKYAKVYKTLYTISLLSSRFKSTFERTSTTPKLGQQIMETLESNDAILSKIWLH